MHRRSLFSFLAVSPLALLPIQSKEPIPEKPSVKLASKPCICGCDAVVLRENGWGCLWCKRQSNEDAS
jgi:hypothetical protein